MKQIQSCLDFIPIQMAKNYITSKVKSTKENPETEPNAIHSIASCVYGLTKWHYNNMINNANSTVCGAIKHLHLPTNRQPTCCAISALGPSSRRRRANDAAILKFLSLKKRFRAVLSVRIKWTGCMLQWVKYAAIYTDVHNTQPISNSYLTQVEHQDWCSLSTVFVKAVRNQMVPPCVEWWGDTDNQATTPFGHCPSTAVLLVWLHWPNARWNRRQDLNSFPLENWRDHQDALVLHGWRLSSRTWNPITSPWMKLLTWLWIVRSGGWCLCLVLRTPTSARQKRKRKAPCV